MTSLFSPNWVADFPPIFQFSFPTEIVLDLYIRILTFSLHFKSWEFPFFSMSLRKIRFIIKIKAKCGLAEKSTYFPKPNRNKQNLSSLVTNYNYKTLWQISVLQDMLPVLPIQSALSVWTYRGQVGVGLSIFYLKSKLRRSKQWSNALRNWWSLFAWRSSKEKNMKCIKLCTAVLELC